MTLLKKVYDSLRLFFRYTKIIGISKAFLFISHDFFKIEKLSFVLFKGRKIFARTSSPDLKVIINTLILSEYDNINCKDPAVIIDAGAYIGSAALYFTQKFPKATILALEPEAANFELLVKNCKEFNKIIPINAALWSSNTTRELNDRFTGQWGYTISNTFNKISFTRQIVNCLSMDDLISIYKIDTIDVLKMDIEGSEKEVFEHASTWIEKVNIISVELHDRINIGCDRAFYLATKNFTKFERKGEKVSAFR